MNKTAVLIALASAALFGLSTPAAKLLAGTVHPVLLAGLLYTGAGIGMAVLRRLWPALAGHGGAPEVALTRAQWPWLGGSIVVGGLIGPALFMIGLARTDAATASLLLTFEGAATALMAWFVFHENFDRRVALGMLLLIAGALTLSWTGKPSFGSVTGPLAVIGACVTWGLDNNLTRKVSLADPFQIVELKGLIAGPVNLVLAFAAGAHALAATSALAAGAVGFLGYGVSISLYVIALRHLGAARTSAYFSTAPFIGVFAAIFALGEPLTLQLIAAGILTAAGVWLHLTERHEHEHVHEPMAHAHPHRHDEHHRHSHRPEDPPGEPHTHWHEHGWHKHSHPHVPDMHHTHRHSAA